MNDEFMQSLIRQTGTHSAEEANRVLCVLSGIQPD